MQMIKLILRVTLCHHLVWSDTEIQQTKTTKTPTQKPKHTLVSENHKCPGWTGLGATWSSERYPCVWQGEWN